jgi:hypothetical protein
MNLLYENRIWFFVKFKLAKKSWPPAWGVLTHGRTVMLAVCKDWPCAGTYFR